MSTPIRFHACMEAFTARVASPDDSVELLRMMAEFNAGEGIEFDPDITAASLDRVLRSEALGIVLLFEHQGNVAGYSVVTWNFDLEYGGRDAFLTELWLAPVFRGKGLGRRALHLTEEACRRNDAAALHLAVRGENTAAVSLYEREGYIDWPRRVLSKPLQ